MFRVCLILNPQRTGEIQVMPFGQKKPEWFINLLHTGFSAVPSRWNTIRGIWMECYGIDNGPRVLFNGRGHGADENYRFDKEAPDRNDPGPPSFRYGDIDGWPVLWVELPRQDEQERYAFRHTGESSREAMETGWAQPIMEMFLFLRSIDNLPRKAFGEDVGYLLDRKTVINLRR